MAKPTKYNPIARDLRTPKYRQRTVPGSKHGALRDKLIDAIREHAETDDAFGAFLKHQEDSER